MLKSSKINKTFLLALLCVAIYRYGQEEAYNFLVMSTLLDVRFKNLIPFTEYEIDKAYSTIKSLMTDGVDISSDATADSTSQSDSEAVLADKV